MSASGNDHPPYRGTVKVGATAAGPPTRVLVVQEAADSRGAVCSGLQALGWDVQLATNELDAVCKVGASPLDAVVLDIPLASGSGFQALEQIRLRTRAPLLVLMADATLSDRLRAFELGASDFVAKPYWVEEIAARIRSLSGRPVFPGRSACLSWGQASLDLDASCVCLRGRREYLTRAELSILSLLIKRAGWVVSRRTLLDTALELRGDTAVRTVDSHVARIRRKLGPEAATIATVWGVGYRFDGKREDGAPLVL